MQQFVLAERAMGSILGFVPTMGALHIGHIALVNQAVEHCDTVVCSIFVNPIQFNNADDLENYPRTYEKDIELLRKSGCKAVFYPEVNEMYPEETKQQYDFGDIEKGMEGKFRPGHFNGVAIVVKKLFDIVQPHKAYFGEKDFQQLAIIKALVRIEKIPVDIEGCATVRENDGLAMSSRNTRLTAEQRKAAPFIYKTLLEVKKKFPYATPNDISVWVGKEFEKQNEMHLEYFEICDPITLQPITQKQPLVHARACIAVRMGNVRLIDNIGLGEDFL